MCIDADDAYSRFKEEYHKSLGKRNFRRLDAKPRTTRITEVGVRFPEWYAKELSEEFGNLPRVPYVIEGLIGTSYCRMFGSDWFPEEVAGFDDEKYERFIDWLLCAGMHNTKQISRRSGKMKRFNKHLYKNRDNGNEKRRKRTY